MKLNLKIWRQENASEKGRLVDYQLDGVTTHMSFLEMMDMLNQQLIEKGERTIEFDHDCREGEVCSWVCHFCLL